MDIRHNDTLLYEFYSSCFAWTLNQYRSLNHYIIISYRRYQ